MKLDNVMFLWCSDEINKNPDKYWQMVINIARNNTLNRITRCSQIMGRKESESLSGAQIMYPCMQCADIFYLKADICQLGLDQRKVNVLAREYCTEKKIKDKPVIISHHMLAGLKKIDPEKLKEDPLLAKMSKSDPGSAIFMEDTEEEVEKKIGNAFCEPKNVKENPVLEYCRYIVIEATGKFVLGDKVYTNYKDLENDFIEDKILPQDLKKALSKQLNSLFQPVRDHFKNDPYAKKILELVRSYQTSR